MSRTGRLVLALLVLAVGLVGCLQDLENSIGSAQGCGVTTEGWPGILLPSDAPGDAPHRVQFDGEAPCLTVRGRMHGTADTVFVDELDPPRDVDVGPLDPRIELVNASGEWVADEETVEFSDRTVELAPGTRIQARLAFDRNGTHFLDTVSDSVSLGGGQGNEDVPVNVSQPGTVRPVQGPGGENGTLHLEGLQALRLQDAKAEAEGLDVELSNLTLVQTSNSRGDWRLNGEPIEPAHDWIGHGHGHVRDGVAHVDFQAMQGTVPSGAPVIGIELEVNRSFEEPVEYNLEQGDRATKFFQVEETSRNGAARGMVRVEGAPKALDAFAIDVCSGRRADVYCTDGDTTRIEAPPGGATNVSVGISADVEPGTYSLELVVTDRRSVHDRVPLQLVVEE